MIRDEGDSRWPPEFLSGGGEMGALMRAHNWTQSPLGPPAQWPDSLKMALSICLNSRFPMVIFWGPEFTVLYNDAWRPILGEGGKHPKALGSPGIEVWPEVWDILGVQLDGVLKRGEATWSEDLLLPLERYGYLEEAYFTYSYSPIRAADGRVGGAFTAVFETTERVSASVGCRFCANWPQGPQNRKASGRHAVPSPRSLGKITRKSLSPSCTWSMTMARASHSRLLPVSESRTIIRLAISRWMGVTGGPLRGRCATVSRLCSTIYICVLRRCMRVFGLSRQHRRLSCRWRNRASMPA